MVKFKCGCIGLPLDEYHYICIISCMRESGYDAGCDAPLFTVNSKGKQQESFIYLSDEERKHYLELINNYILDGQRYREFKNNLHELMKNT